MAAISPLIGSSAASPSYMSGAISGLSGIGAGLQAGGNIAGGYYSAQVARNNEAIAQQSATYATEAGNVQAQNEGLKNAQIAGQLKASQAANNVDVNSGSALAVQEGQRATGELDTQTVLHNALLQAYGYQQQATSYKAQAAQDVTAGLESGAGSLLSNASSLGLRWSGTPGAAGPSFSNTPGASPNDLYATSSYMNFS